MSSVELSWIKKKKKRKYYGMERLWLDYETATKKSVKTWFMSEIAIKIMTGLLMKAFPGYNMYSTLEKVKYAERKVVHWYQPQIRSLLHSPWDIVSIGYRSDVVHMPALYVIQPTQKCCLQQGFLIESNAIVPRV